MKRKLTPQQVQNFNLFVKSFKLNREIISKSSRREVVRQLNRLGFIKGKADTDTLIRNLYHIKKRLIEELKETQETKQEVIQVEKDRVFERIEFKPKKKGRKSISFHVPKKSKPKKKKEIKNLKKQAMIKKTPPVKKRIEKPVEIRKVESKEVYVKKKLQQGKLMRFITKDAIRETFSDIEHIYEREIFKASMRNWEDKPKQNKELNKLLFNY